MFKNVELDSYKYWLESTNRDQQLVRKFRRKKAFERATMFVLFTGTAGVLGVMLANGYFDQVDVIGTCERVAAFFNIR